MMSNRRILSGISSAAAGATLSAYLLYRDGWCPLGRAAVYMILCAVANIKHAPIAYNYRDSDEVHNEMFSARADITDRPYVSQPFKSLSCHKILVNTAALFLYFVVNAYENYAGDQIIYAAAVVGMSRSVFLRAISCVVILYSLHTTGVPHIVHLIRAACIVCCFWICRSPQVDYRLTVLMALYNFFVFVEDGSVICSSLVHCVPPMLPSIGAVLVFNARPCGILTLIAVLACVQ